MCLTYCVYDIGALQFVVSFGKYGNRRTLIYRLGTDEELIFKLVCPSANL